MTLLEHRSEGVHTVRWVRADAIGVGTEELRASFLITPDALVTEWPAQSLETIDEGAIAAILALGPELVLLGTGHRQRMAPQPLLAAFLRRGIGLEAMDNAAAARTYNLLAGEGRRAVAAFLLPG